MLYNWQQQLIYFVFGTNARIPKSIVWSIPRLCNDLVISIWILLWHCWIETKKLKDLVGMLYCGSQWPIQKMIGIWRVTLFWFSKSLHLGWKSVPIFIPWVRVCYIYSIIKLGLFNVLTIYLSQQGTCNILIHFVKMDLCSCEGPLDAHKKQCHTHGFDEKSLNDFRRHLSQ